MPYKLVACSIECTADSDSSVKWNSAYVGVVHSEMPIQKTSRIMWDAIAPQYKMLCGAIDEFSLNTCEWCLAEIQKLERGEVDEVDSSTEAFVFFLRKDRPITFEFQYAENGPQKKGGEVTLAQFKLAVQTYLQFLRDPERKPIEVPFPE